MTDDEGDATIWIARNIVDSPSTLDATRANVDALARYAIAAADRMAVMERVVEGFIEAVTAASRHQANRGRGGQQVSFHGDFANATPSVLSRLEWWARAMTDAQRKAVKP